MDFTKKNDFIVKNKNEKFFDQDLRLFKEYCPNSRLNSDIKRVNSFNKRILDGHMLFELLDKVTPEEILKNREMKPEVKVISTLDTVDSVSEFLKKESPEMEYPASVLENLVGKTEGEILNLLEFGKLFITQSEEKTRKEAKKKAKKDADEKAKKEVEGQAKKDTEEKALTESKEQNNTSTPAKKKASTKSSKK